MPLQVEMRPEEFDEFYGNEAEVESLLSMLKRDSIPHAFLFTGPSGCGKTTLARLTADALGVFGTINYRELNSSDFRGIDTIREIKSMYHSAPAPPGKYRVWMMDEVHQLTKDAQEAILKMLEEPPEHVVFLLCTTEPEKLKDTVKRRCARIQLAPLQDDDLESLLGGVLESIDKSVPNDVINQIVQDSMGSPGKALNILDKIIDMKKGDQLKAAKMAAEKETKAIELCRALMRRSKWKEVANILTELKGEDPEGLRRLILSYCSTILLKGDDPKAALIMMYMQESFFYTGFAGLIYSCYQIFYDE